ncbi:MAG: helix-turn-helix domain-containing protein [Candidatus Roizmanbacteria bacterium]
MKKKIKVREKYLRAIEENNWDFFSSKIYITGILKNYSRLLGLDEKKVLAFFRRDYEKKDEVKFKRKVSQQYLTPETRQVLRRGFIIIFLFFIFYFGYQLKLYFVPPRLTILSPKITSFFREDRVKIIGRTEKDAMVVIAEERVYQNKDGVFEYNFPLHDGENKLIIELTGANGRKAKIEKIFTKKSTK